MNNKKKNSALIRDCDRFPIFCAVNLVGMSLVGFFPQMSTESCKEHNMYARPLFQMMITVITSRFFYLSPFPFSARVAAVVAAVAGPSDDGAFCDVSIPEHCVKRSH